MLASRLVAEGFELLSGMVYPLVWIRLSSGVGRTTLSDYKTPDTVLKCTSLGGCAEDSLRFKSNFGFDASSLRVFYEWRSGCESGTTDELSLSSRISELRSWIFSSFFDRCCSGAYSGLNRLRDSTIDRLNSFAGYPAFSCSNHSNLSFHLTVSRLLLSNSSSLSFKRSCNCFDSRLAYSNSIWSCTQRA